MFSNIRSVECPNNGLVTLDALDMLTNTLEGFVETATQGYHLRRKDYKLPAGEEAGGLVIAQY